MPKIDKVIVMKVDEDLLAAGVQISRVLRTVDTSPESIVRDALRIDVVGSFIRTTIGVMQFLDPAQTADQMQGKVDQYVSACNQAMTAAPPLFQSDLLSLKGGTDTAQIDLEILLEQTFSSIPRIKHSIEDVSGRSLDKMVGDVNFVVEASKIVGMRDKVRAGLEDIEYYVIDKERDQLMKMQSPLCMATGARAGHFLDLIDPDDVAFWSHNIGERVMNAHAAYVPKIVMNLPALWSKYVEHRQTIVDELARQYDELKHKPLTQGTWAGWNISVLLAGINSDLVDTGAALQMLKEVDPLIAQGEAVEDAPAV